MLAAGDLDGDGNQDLAVGAPFENDGKRDRAGAVNVIYGSPTGLKKAGNQLWDIANSGFPVDGPQYDYFGYTLAIGRFNGDGTSDLAIGVPGEKVGKAEVGAVHVLYGSDDGLSATGAQDWTQDSPGVLDEASFADDFGAALAAADFDNDGFHNLAIGVPNECRSDPCDGNVGEGAVSVLRGSSGGLTGDGDQFWTQDSPGVLENSERGNSFGGQLARGDMNGDGLIDLLVANSNESLGDVPGAGDVQVFYGGSDGLGADGNQLWSQNSPGVPDSAEENEYFAVLFAN